MPLLLLLLVFRIGMDEGVEVGVDEAERGVEVGVADAVVVVVVVVGKDEGVSFLLFDLDQNDILNYGTKEMPNWVWRVANG